MIYNFRRLKSFNCIKSIALLQCTYVNLVSVLCNMSETKETNTKKTYDSASQRNHRIVSIQYLSSRWICCRFVPCWSLEMQPSSSRPGLNHLLTKSRVFWRCTGHWQSILNMITIINIHSYSHSILHILYSITISSISPTPDIITCLCNLQFELSIQIIRSPFGRGIHQGLWN